MAAKAKLVDTTMLQFPVTSAPLALTTDASEKAVGAVLEQFTEGDWHPLAFFSRKLREPEKKYAT